MWLPSGGSLIIDRTEAMTVVDVNTGKFTGSGGNLEETVTKNNLEAAEEIVRQLRLRDIGGIIVVDFIDMVLESNRDLVLRRLVECLGRDRTRHQVAEVTSLGLVQMTRKRIGTGLLEAFSHDCEHCKGRGVIVQDHPVEPGSRSDDDESRGRRSRGGRNRGGRGGQGGQRRRQRAATAATAAAAARRRRRPRTWPTPARPRSRPTTSRPTRQTDPDSPRQPSETDEDSGPDEVRHRHAVGRPAEPADRALDAATRPPRPSEARAAPTSRARGARGWSPAPGVVRRDAPPVRRRPAPTCPAAAPAPSRLPSAEPVDVPVEPAVPGHEPDDGRPAADEATRGHAGPDVADATATGERTTSDERAGRATGFSLLHVPIKRKGSRKR